jgi:hypothetical protein
VLIDPPGPTEGGIVLDPDEVFVTLYSPMSFRVSDEVKEYEAKEIEKGWGCVELLNI